MLVLCYHALSETWPAALSTTPERFEEQLELLLGRGYTPTTFSHALADPPGDRTLAVTFDDAYRSVLELAHPIMERLGVRGTVFAPTDWVGRGEPMTWSGIDQWLGGPHEQELVCLGWPELRELGTRGWEVGSHTCSHPHLTEVDDERLANELSSSKAACEEGMGRPCGSIAYPYGDVDARVTRATKAAGYAVGAALPKRHGSKDPLDWPRVGVYNRDDLRRFRLKASPLLRRLRS